VHDPSPVFLIGFMATGKSTVGRLAAERLGRRFVDLDDVIEERAGRRIGEIFRQEGEEGFRRREAQALAVVAGEPDAVVACGGGAPCFGDNLERMRGAGIVVALRASLAEILRRAALPGEPERPLLGGSPGFAGRGAVGPLIDAERLYAARQAVYESADVVVASDGRTPDDLADEVATRARLRLGDVAVKLGPRSYPIHLAPLSMTAALVRERIGSGRLAIITDENVARAGHAAALGVEAPVFTVPPGEGSKTLAQVERLASECARAGLDRRSAILALGGGVVGDLAGFVAAVLYRGIPVAQIPTTLLAMVDSAIGGKTGVDLPEGKNLAGAFWQPRFVLADLATLATLPAAEKRAAFGEILKYGLLGDPALFEAVEARGEAVDLADVVLRCAKKKAEVVSADELEQRGLRATLNLGHTVGHAIEAASGRLHGECVALGLVAAARVSERLRLSAGLEARVVAALRRVGLDAELDPWLREDVLAYIGVDKKRAEGKVRFVALEGVGRPRLVDLAPAELGQILRSADSR
jgi:shikimate kinase / 3-dehydroquinate synthase